MSILLEEIARKIEGARVEDNRFCISVHYRKVVREEVLEIRPSIEQNKGHALEYSLDTLQFSNSVVFLNFDVTLSPIFDDPDRSFMSNERLAAVREVPQYFPTSGRSRERVIGD